MHEESLASTLLSHRLNLPLTSEPRNGGHDMATPQPVVDRNGEPSLVYAGFRLCLRLEGRLECNKHRGADWCPEMEYCIKEGHDAELPGAC